jgi:3-dehydroquinate synthetase
MGRLQHRDAQRWQKVVELIQVPVLMRQEVLVNFSKLSSNRCRDKKATMGKIRENG